MSFHFELRIVLTPTEKLNGKGKFLTRTWLISYSIGDVLAVVAVVSQSPQCTQVEDVLSVGTYFLANDFTRKFII